ncbi:hypothetical protein Poli38472_004369 [Pythium oligandrum]|uniref:Protein kinase domain-containing protein n=1 Tax=Pythium oligandrum TaxID=41045 RepID=A0A8K1CAK5_PYTOL|nr:hypothetical protein Poli38472_004369 [Pythium oligandrum]|eukprot:TMW59300.1 hypothetical protein Poli38472_004369 [Pythium oligandrum]
MRMRFMYNTAKGMAYLHHFERPILHRDLRSPNLLVDQNYTTKIELHHQDLGFRSRACQAHVQAMTGDGGTVQWMSPEVLGNQKYTEKADVFSFGIIIWEIMTGECPYDVRNRLKDTMEARHEDQAQRPVDTQASMDTLTTTLLELSGVANAEALEPFPSSDTPQETRYELAIDAMPTGQVPVAAKTAFRDVEPAFESTVDAKDTIRLVRDAVLTHTISCTCYSDWTIEALGLVLAEEVVFSVAFTHTEATESVRVAFHLLQGDSMHFLDVVDNIQRQCRSINKQLSNIPDAEQSSLLSKWTARNKLNINAMVLNENTLRELLEDISLDTLHPRIRENYAQQLKDACLYKANCEILRLSLSDELLGALLRMLRDPNETTVRYGLFILLQYSEEAELWSRLIDVEVTEQRRALASSVSRQVYLGQYEERLVAIRSLLPAHMRETRHIKIFCDDIRLMTSLEHPKIAAFIGVSWDTLHNLSVIAEYMEGGALNHILYETDRPLSWSKEKLSIATDVIEALIYLHTMQPTIIHRELWSKNVLLASEGEAKLNLFKISQNRMREEAMTLAIPNSLLWMAPEVIMGEAYVEKADIYSFGVLLSELDTRQVPFSSLRDDSGERLQPFRILQMVAMKRLQVELSAECPSELKALAQQCMAFKPDNRPTAMQVAHMLRSRVAPSLLTS